MARKGTLHRFSIALSDVDRDVYETLDLRVARHPSESDRHLLLRVLAYALLYRPGITFSKGGVSDGDVPPVSVTSPDGRLVLWIEIDVPPTARLRRASHRVDAIRLVVAGDEAIRRAEAAIAEAPPHARVGVLGIAPALLEALEGGLGRAVAWSLVRADDVLHLTEGERTHAGAVTERP